MSANDFELRTHREWLGYVQPVGLVVSAAALAGNGVFVNRNVAREQQVLVSLLKERGVTRANETLPTHVLSSFEQLAMEFLGWERSDLLGLDADAPVPAELEVALPEFSERLTPTFAVPDPDAAMDAPTSERILLLIQELATDQDFDEPVSDSERGWHASPQARFERLLRETGVSQGLLVNGVALRIVYAPHHESSGHATFVFSQLARPDGRVLVGALHMLLSAPRLFTVPTQQRFAALLKESRRYQNQVSTKLADQVLESLLELLRGFAAADAASQGCLLRDVLSAKPDDVYGGLLTTLMRLVFLLYAEERGLLPQDPVFAQNYSVIGLFEKLRDDAGRNPDTMDQRYGAWARLLALFRLIYEGGGHGSLRLPARHGRLFDPDAYPFLEGRALGSHWRDSPTVSPPRVPDGVLWRVLEKLLVLDSERLSYRVLDVEQIGSVYEAMMGFHLETARGASIAVRPDHVVVDLDSLLEVKPAERAKRLAEDAACKLAAGAAKELGAATSVDSLVAALGRRISPHTPAVIPAGSLYLQPTEERRRSGAHYTPRTLTEPIVRTTLEPILETLGPTPHAEQILTLRVCDPAMGSGAFLVEACRFLASQVVRGWELHGDLPAIPPDETPQLFAERLVAQKCLYGVDKNPFAVDLAKLSLWLATFAKEHPFTFLDHALRAGDSLVGLSREQIASFHWETSGTIPTLRKLIDERLETAETLRLQIRELADSDATDEKAKLLAESDAAIDELRFVGDLVIAAFFAESKPKKRDEERKRSLGAVELWLGGKRRTPELVERRAALRGGEQPIQPFHWEIEFPEVFAREPAGFDAFVGNPPFAGKNTITAANRAEYLHWLQELHPESHGNSDLVAHFYRRAFSLLRSGGAFGLIATNTIAQGDTRYTGLRWICTHGGTIYAARKRVKWPGAAAVVVSVVHVAKREGPMPCRLDGRRVERITAFLFHDGGHESPAVLAANAGKSFIGSYVLGMGFTFGDENEDATSIAEMGRLIARDPRNRERIFPYMGGEELNDSPTHSHRRYVINFGEMSEAEARRWPDLMRIIEGKVKPSRLHDNRASYRERWWQYAEKRSELYAAIQGLDRVLACCRHQPNWAVGFLPASVVFAESLVLFASSSSALLALLQSRPHEIWARFFGSTLEDRLRYTPSDCFETFPFPKDWEKNEELERVGGEYYEYRAALMIRNNEGLTSTYNRFHDPDEQSLEIARLRELHAAMDRAVLDAYGWSDLDPQPKFLLDYEEEEADDGESKSRRKKPWRYRWPDENRDEVLARLLALNRERAAAEKLAGSVVEKSTTAKKAKRRTKRGSGSPPLF